ncbi:MAG: single-stranded-DNA-specific exonuclease RecJ [Chloroflexota bacterium]
MKRLFPGIERIWLDAENIPIPQDIRHLIGDNSLLAQTLVRRGLKTFEKARAFLDPRFYRPADPCELPDMEKGVNLIHEAIRTGKKIAVWGDFDVDGQTATTLLVSTLRSLGGQVEYYIPVRERESHGVHINGLERMLNNGVKVILTCDTGISAHNAADFLKQHGITFVITDHHALPTSLPSADAIINPQRLAEDHPMHTLAGVGTAFVFSQLLCHQASKPEIAEEHLDLVALGCIADVAVLRGDTRYWVQRGLEMLRNPRRPALLQLMQNAEINPAHLNEQHIGFSLAPRLNAIGRLGDANPVVNFLLSTDSQAIAVFAAQLEGYNSQRRFLTDQVFLAALQQIDQDPRVLDYAVLVLHHPEWPGGINGIVASRLAEIFQRPVILLSSPPGQPMRGSARSVEGINITEAIASANHLLIGFGGHPMAAGLALQPENFHEFRRRVSAHVEYQRTHHQQKPAITVDAWLKINELDLKWIEELEKLAPFGAGNPPLVFASRNLTLLDSTPIGKTQEHLMTIVEDEEGNTRRVIWWQGARSMLPEGRFDLAYHARPVNFGGDLEVQLEWIVARPLEMDSITISKTTRLEVIDFRTSQSLIEEITRKNIPSEQILFWADGAVTLDIPVKQRWELTPAETLVICTPPPSQKVLSEAIQQVRASRIILGWLEPPVDKPQSFLHALTGMIQYVLKKNSGKASLLRMAAALNQREETILTGIEWLAGKGFIRIMERDGQSLTIAEGGIPDPLLAREMEARLRSLLEESRAFREFYRQASSDSLIPEKV